MRQEEENRKELQELTAENVLAWMIASVMDQKVKEWAEKSLEAIEAVSGNGVWWNEEEN